MKMKQVQSDLTGLALCLALLTLMEVIQGQDTSTASLDNSGLYAAKAAKKPLTYRESIKGKGLHP